MHACSYARPQRESSCCATVVWTRVWVCGGAALLSRATQRCVELRGHDSAIPRCMARSASWPSIKLAGLICNWISMTPSNVAIVIRSRYLAAPKAHRKFWPSPPPPHRQIGHAGGGVWGVLIWAPPPRGDAHPPQRGVVPSCPVRRTSHGQNTGKGGTREGQGRDKEPDRNLTPYGQGTGHYGQGTGHYGHPTDTRGHEGTCPRALLGPHL